MLLVLLARAVLSWIVTMVGPSAAGPVRVATRFDKLAVPPRSLCAHHGDQRIAVNSVRKGAPKQGLRSLPGNVEEDLRQFARLGEHRPVAGVHLDQSPGLAGQQLGYVAAELGSGEQALDVRRREFAKWARQDGRLG
jgi:hypothetical protein